MKLYLVRHGQSTGNVAGTLLGQGDHPLTELGEKQARAAAARLAPFGPMPLHCSDLARAMATAEYIARAWAKPVAFGDLLDAASRPPAPAGPGSAAPALLPDPRLREIDLGDYEGRPWEEFEADEQLMTAFAEDPYRTSLPGGESLAHIETRVMAAVRDILGAHGLRDDGGLTTESVATADASASATGLHAAEQDDAACIVSHDGPIRAILNHYLGVPPEKWWTLSTTHGGVSLLEFSGGWVNIRFMNATSHLAGLDDAPADAPSGAD
ncbi:MAG: histidine phosphatase family protein [Actinomycetes bacterium]